MKCRRGFTLIEIIIVITILSVFSLAFASFISQATDAWYFIKSRSTASGTARYSINRISSELRRIAAPNQILTMGSTECKFNDIDGALVDFKQTGNSIYRNSDILAAGSVMPNGLIFTYQTDAGASTAISSEVRSIRVRISVQKNQETSVLETSARLRNL